MKQRIVSGIKPSGDVHIGNYLGAIAQWVTLQDQYDAVLFIADLHAVTVPQKPADLRRRTLEIAKIYLASGIDPEKVTMFVQSQVPEHAELCWLLNTVTRNGDLTKMTQFKDKSGFDIEQFENSLESSDAKESFQLLKEKFNASPVGLFDYPVLMAGDIMMYDAKFVPVGDDQVQHIELARTLGRRFNKQFGEMFQLPQPLLQTEGSRIMALDNPEKKMSKSGASDYGYIALMDTPEDARKKIMRAVTDSDATIRYDATRKGLYNLITMYSLLTQKSGAEVEALYTGKGYADFKKDLGDIVADFLENFQEKYASISDEEVLKTLQQGAEKARVLAHTKVQKIKSAMGFLQ